MRKVRVHSLTPTLYQQFKVRTRVSYGTMYTRVYEVAYTRYPGILCVSSYGIMLGMIRKPYPGIHCPQVSTADIRVRFKFYRIGNRSQQPTIFEFEGG